MKLLHVVLILCFTALLSRGDDGEAVAPNAFVEKQLSDIVIPEIDFTDATLEEAVDFLRRASLANDPEHKAGIGMIVSRGEARSGEKLNQRAPSPLINLQLSNVPLSQALRETVDAAGFDYRIGTHKIEIFPKPEPAKFPADGQILKIDPKLTTVDALAKKLGYEVRTAAADRGQIVRYYYHQSDDRLATVELTILVFKSKPEALAQFKSRHDPSEAEGILKKVDGIGEQCTDLYSDDHRAVQIGNIVMKAIQVGSGDDHKKLIDEVLATLKSENTKPAAKNKAKED